MLWVVQKNLYNDNRRGELLEALSRLDIPFLEVDVHHNTISPEIPEDNTLPIITNGSIMLSNIALTRGWEPGCFMGDNQYDNFSYDVWAHYYENLLLNAHATRSTLAQAKVVDPFVFVRPILDNKTFNGKVFSQEEFLAFQQDSIHLKTGSPQPDTEILLSQPKKIGQEHRHYIVDGEIVTSSRYKLAGQPNFKEGCDKAVLDVVQQAIDIWTPSRAFVLDTYIAGDEIGIVEIGCICHAGLYESNLMKLVYMLDSMPVELAEKNQAKFK
jgi:hypothetical protein